jgi:hypothetical protein
MCMLFMTGAEICLKTRFSEISFTTSDVPGVHFSGTYSYELYKLSGIPDFFVTPMGSFLQIYHGRILTDFC